MTGALAGRVAIVTGAGDGIGRGIARRFARDGAHLVLADIDRVALDAVAAGLQAAPDARIVLTTTDVARKPDVVAMVQAALDAFGTVDVLVNNAWGGGRLSRVEHKTDDDLAAAFAVGYYGPFWAMQATFPAMRARGYGRIVNLCSLNGVNAHVGTLEYNSAKEALRTLTRTAAREWAPYGIVVNAVCPAARSGAAAKVFAEHPELAELADRANPMGRMGDPEADVAPVVAFLAGEDARYLTGNTLFVDGGAHINGVAWAPELPDTPPG